MKLKEAKGLIEMKKAKILYHDEELNSLLVDAVKEWDMNNRDIIHSCDMFGNHPYEVIEWAYKRGKEQGKKESLLLRQSAEKALAKKYMLSKLNWVILLLSSQMNKKKIKTFVEGEIVAINNEKEFENWWSNERKAD